MCFRGLRGVSEVRGGSKMLIEIRELEVHAVDFDEQIAPGVIDFGLGDPAKETRLAPRGVRNWCRSIMVSTS